MSKFEITGEGQVRLGKYTTIGVGAKIVFAKPGIVEIDDYCTIGARVKLVCSGGNVRIGDWSTLHDDCLVLSGTGVEIGAHCWFGQNCILDGSGGLTIRKGVRVGMYSQIWSHVAAGEQIEGCTLIGERPVVIEEDVWLVGSCIVASGVTLGRRSVALIGSNITKSWPFDSVLAGTPAVLKTGLSFYHDLSLDEKWALLRGWLQDAILELRANLQVENKDILFISLEDTPHERIAFVRDKFNAISLRESKKQLTVCCIEDKTYNKQLNLTEQRLLKYLSGNKARFNALV